MLKNPEKKAGLILH